MMELKLTLNGKPLAASVEPDCLLIDFLRAPVIPLSFQPGGSSAHVSDRLCKIHIGHHDRFLLVLVGLDGILSRL